MKKLYFALIAFCFLSFANAQIINITDANFKAKLLAANSSNEIAKNLVGNYFKIYANNDGEIQESEALTVSYLDLKCNNCNNLQKITSLNGLNNFNQLKNLITLNNNLNNYDLEIVNNNVIEYLDLKDDFKSIKIQNTINLNLLRFSENYNPNGDILIDNAPNLTTNFNIVFLVSINISGNFTIKNCNQITKLQFTRNSGGIKTNNISIENLTNLNEIIVTGDSTGSNTSFPYTINQLNIKNTPQLNSLQI